MLDADGTRVIQKKADAKAKGQLWRVVEVSNLSAFLPTLKPRQSTEQPGNG